MCLWSDIRPARKRINLHELGKCQKSVSNAKNRQPRQRNHDLWWGSPASVSNPAERPRNSFECSVFQRSLFVGNALRGEPERDGTESVPYRTLFPRNIKDERSKTVPKRKPLAECELRACCPGVVPDRWGTVCRVPDGCPRRKPCAGNDFRPRFAGRIHFLSPRPCPRGQQIVWAIFSRPCVGYGARCNFEFKATIYWARSSVIKARRASEAM
jgi:hypothetical protein